MSSATAGRGILLKRGAGDGPPETFTTIAEVTSVTGPTESADQIDVTSFDSTAHEFIAALPDSGEVSFEANFVGSNAQQQGLRSDLRAGTVRNFQLILNDATLEASRTTVAFSAIVTALEVAASGFDSQVTMSCTLKVSGTPSWTYASA